MRPPVAATRHHRFRDPRTRRRLRRDLARQPLSRTGRRHPVAVVPVPLRAEQELDPLLRARARDQPVSARHRAHAQPLSAPAHRMRGHPAGLGRRGVAVAICGSATVRRSPPVSSSVRSAGTSTPSPRSTSTGSRTSAEMCCGPTPGTTPTTSPANASRSSARAPRACRSRPRCRTRPHRWTSTSARPPGCCPRWTSTSRPSCGRSSGCRDPSARSMRWAAGRWTRPCWCRCSTCSAGCPTGCWWRRCRSMTAGAGSCTGCCCGPRSTTRPPAGRCCRATASWPNDRSSRVRSCRPSTGPRHV